jgi:NAD(P)-dependent dehydrogenase (short-subunit alcohol dehydrogenase family)
MDRFAGRTVLVTGAAHGVGRACALRVAAEGGDLVLWDAADCTDTAALVASAGRTVEAHLVELADPDAVERALTRSVAGAGPIWGAINAATRLAPPMPVGEYDANVWSAVLEANLGTVFACLRHELAHMAANGAGSVVTIASVAGLRASAPGLGAYVAAKHGVVGLTRAAAQDYASAGIRVNAVCSGLLATEHVAEFEERNRALVDHLLERIPMGRAADAAEIAAAAAFLLSDDASYITGEALTVNGGAL